MYLTCFLTTGTIFALVETITTFTNSIIADGRPKFRVYVTVIVAFTFPSKFYADKIFKIHRKRLETRSSFFTSLHPSL